MLGFKVLILAVHVLVSLICASHQYLSHALAHKADSRKLISVTSPESTSMIRASPGNKGKKPRVFDVTRYGAVPNGAATETSSAFLAAWHDACAHPGNATLLVPNGTFFIGPVTFEGPCHNKHSPMVTIRGILKAPSRLSSFPTSTWIVFRKLHGLNLTGETDTTILDGQGAKAWALGSSDKKNKPLSRPISLKFAHVSNGTIRNIGLLNSKNFHMTFSHCKDIVVDGVKITAPWNSPNTDGIHISGSTNIRITSSTIGVGDDCVSIGPGTTNISIVNVMCGPGHGISIGSLGKYPKERNVRGVTVKNCTINGTQNGVRVKTWPGSPPSMASNLTFQDIVMINVSNPIVIDQEYCPNHTCLNYKPSRVKLRNIHFRNIKGTYRTKSAVTLVCSSRVACENIEIVNVKLNHTTEETPLAPSFKVKGTLKGLQILV